ncbi:PASTA domain-containing protein [Pseudonocardia sp. T1-2H]|uniref:PASTA domain-containing protein n=1 Tax=Pseudonocardia sp. T1-2H TaxID=3128899 RepID=UPI0031014AEF
MERSLMYSRLALSGAALAALLTLAGCGGGTTAAPVTVTVPAPATVVTAAPAATQTPAPATLTVPDLTGQNGAIAESTLKSMGFTNVRLAADPTSGKSLVALPENWTVTKVDPKPGSELAAGQLVVVTMTK